MADTSKWVWMPHAAHLIVGNDCRFHLATFVGNYVVSTVGEYLPDSAVREILADSRGVKLEGRGDVRRADWLNKIGYEEIGCDRTYETMVFKAEPSEVKDSAWQCCPWQADVSDGEKDFRGYNTASAAYNGHLELCEKWSKEP